MVHDSTLNPQASGLGRICAAAGAILAAVEDAPTARSEVDRDANDAFLRAAYGRAYRCLRSIRDLACRGEADDAMILTRALLSIAARSLYLVATDDPDERARRFDSARRSWAEQALSTLDALTAAGFEPADDRERIAEIVTSTEGQGVPPLPNDRDVLASLGLEPFYARVYKLASDVFHSRSAARSAAFSSTACLTATQTRTRRSPLSCATTIEPRTRSRWR